LNCELKKRKRQNAKRLKPLGKESKNQVALVPIPRWFIFDF
jgi:hypothetical protein